MRSLFPDAGDVDPVDAYLAATRPAPAGRPWVTVGMVESLDGATAIEGRSGALGGPADREVFRAVRAVADVLLVGAGTARAERYGPFTHPAGVVAARERVGRTSGPPQLAVVSSGLHLEPTDRVFAEAVVRPLVFTTQEAPADRAAALAEVADVHRAGTGRVDVALALAVLGDHGASVVVSEGGPLLNGALLDADAVDELCLTIAPMLAGGESARIVRGAADHLHRYDLASLLTADGLVFGRWVRAARDP